MNKTPTAASPTPTADSSVVLAQVSISQWQALKEAGWWTRYDWIIVSLILAVWVITGFWLLFSPADPEGVSKKDLVLLAVFLVSLELKMFWMLSLIFRCSWFVLKAHADIAMLPHASARIAVAYLAGKQPQG